MKTLRVSKLLPALLRGFAALLICGQASAIKLSAYVYNPYQVSKGSVVSMGHVAIGNTNFNKLTVGGTYTASCIHPMMSPTDGQRTESTSAFFGGLSLTVTIPEVLPAYIGMPGFMSVERGAVVQCNYRWTARAVEGGYKVGGGGIGVGIGEGETSTGGTREFVMQRPSLNDEEPSSTCLP